MERRTEYIFGPEELIRIFVSKIQPGSTIHWNNLRCIVSNFQFVYADPPRFRTLLTAITNVLQRHECRNVFVMADVLQILFYRVLGNFFHYPRALSAVACVRDAYFQVRYYENYVEESEFAKIFYVPHSELEVAIEMDAVRHAAMCGNIFFLKLLLKFGAMMLPPHDHWQEMWNCDNQIYKIFSRSGVMWLKSPKYWAKRFDERFNAASWKRLFILLRGLEILGKILTKPQMAQTYARCWRLLWKSLPLPIITSKEIKTFLYKLVGDIVLEEEIDSVFHQYEKYFPESSEPLGPRSLLDLCRCQARQNLRTARTFCYGVESLEIPSRLKALILLKEDDDDSLDTPVQSIGYGPYDPSETRLAEINEEFFAKLDEFHRQRSSKINSSKIRF